MPIAWSYRCDVCRWLFSRGVLRSFSARSADGAASATVARCLGSGIAACCRSVLPVALRAVFLPRGNRVARIGRRCGGFVFDLVMELSLVARNGVRDLTRSSVPAVLRVGHRSCIWLGGDVAVGREPEN